MTTYEEIVKLVAELPGEKQAEAYRETMAKCYVPPTEIMYTIHDLVERKHIDVPPECIRSYDEDPALFRDLLYTNVRPKESLDDYEDEPEEINIGNFVNRMCSNYNMTTGFIGFLVGRTIPLHHSYLIKKMGLSRPFDVDNEKDMKFVRENKYNIDKALGDILDQVKHGIDEKQNVEEIV